MANVRREINKLMNELEETVGTKCSYCISCDRWMCNWKCSEHPKAFGMGEPIKDSTFDPKTCHSCGKDRFFTFDLGDREIFDE